MHRAILGRRSDKLQRRFTAVSNEVDGKCVLNLEKREQYSNKTSMRWKSVPILSTMVSFVWSNYSRVSELISQ